MQVDDPGFDELEKADVKGTWDRLRALEHQETVRVRGPQGPGDAAALEKAARGGDPSAEEQRARDESRRLAAEDQERQAAEERDRADAQARAREAEERAKAEQAAAQEPQA